MNCRGQAKLGSDFVNLLRETASPPETVRSQPQPVEYDDRERTISDSVYFTPFKVYNLILLSPHVKDFCLI